MDLSLISITEAARILGVSPFTIRRLAKSGSLRTVTVGARRLVPLGEIERVGQFGAGRPRGSNAVRGSRS